MRARILCLLTLLLLLAGGTLCEPEPTPVPTTTPTPTRVRAPTPTSTAMPTPQPMVTLRWNLGAEPGTVDPAHARSDAQMDAARQLFLGLTAYHPRTSQPIPDLAIHWTASEGGLVYTFYLRRNVQWVQRDPGTGRVMALRPVTAHDVVYSLRRAVAHSDAAYVLDVIQNTRAIRTASGTRDAETLGVAALDDYIVRFTLERPAAYLPAVLAHPVAWPVPQEVMEAHGDQWTEPQYIMTNGPYTLAQWDHEKRLTLEKNPLYYGADAVQIERVECITADETSTALAFYENGELDAVYLPPQFLRRTFSGRYTPDPVLSRQLYSAPRPVTSYLVFNTHKPPFDDAHVRRAFSYAVDRETLVDVIMRDGSWPAQTFAPPGVFGSAADDPHAGIAFDPEQARQELALAGYPKGKGFPTVQVRYGYCDQDEIAQKIAQTIAGMWGDHLGVNVEIVCQPQGLLVGCPDVTWLPHVELAQWVADIPDQHGVVYEQFVLEPVWSRKTQCDLWLLADELQMQDFKQRLTAASGELDSFRRQALYREAEQLLCVDVCAVAPLFHASQVWLTKPYLHRDYPVMGRQNFKDWWLEPHE